MITTKADELVRSLIEAGLHLTDFTILATKVTRIQRDFKLGHEDRRQRDRLRQQEKLKEQTLFEQQLKDEEERKQRGLAKLRELGYVISDDTYQTSNQLGGTNKSINPMLDSQFPLTLMNNQKKIKIDPSLNFYSKEINEIRQKQRDCCLTFNIDYDLRLNQKNLERACRTAKRNIYQLRAERFNRPEHRSILSVETITQHNRLKEAIRELNKIFLESKSSDEQRVFQELISYINQYEGDVDLLMCQMQYEPKVKETILFAPVTTDILDRMNLILHIVRSLAKKISTGDSNTNDDGMINSNDSDQLNLPDKATYVIKIKTNDHAGSALSDDAIVTVKLYGTNNKSSDVRLIQSINQTKWQAGQIDLFNIVLNYLGEIYAIELGHDSEYSSWKVDWVDIIDDGANIYHFPIDRRFDKHSDEKTTRFIVQRDTGPVRRLPTKPTKPTKPYKQIGFSTYTVQVKTGKKPNKTTDSSIFMQMKGENGSFADVLCSANSAFKGSVFEPDQLDTFYLVWPDLGKIDSLNLSIQSDGVNPPWFCEYITVEDNQNRENYKFIINQLFDGSNTDDRHAKKTVTVYPEKTKEENTKKGSAEKTKPSYLVKIKTGEKGLDPTATPPAINLVLQGEKNKSNPYTLPTSDKNRNSFRSNQTDEFVIPSEYHVGSIKSLTLTADHTNEPLFIENIIVRDIRNGQDFMFPIHDWLNEPNGKNTITAQSINERKPQYIVHTRTVTSELKGPDRTIKLNVQGKNGTAQMQLDRPVSMLNSFQPGRKDEYYIDHVPSLGEIQSIEVDVTHPNIKKLGLDYIEIKDRTKNESYRFNINRMLDAKTPKMVANAEQISHPNASLTKVSGGTKSNQLLTTKTTTGASDKKSFEQLSSSVPQGAKRPTTKQESGTPLNVARKENDSNSSTQSQSESDRDSAMRKNRQQSSDSQNQDHSSVNIPNVVNLKSAAQSTDESLTNQSSTPTLDIANEKRKKNVKVPITPPTEMIDKQPKNNFPVQLPISSTDTDTEGISPLKPTIPKSTRLEMINYQIKLKTLKREFLDKETKLQVELIDDKGQSEQKILDPTTTLDKGKSETFVIETKKNFDRIKKIKLSLIGSKSKKQDLYQADYIEIVDPKTKKTHRIDYGKDDVLNVDKNRLDIVKSIRPDADLDVRERMHPQGTSIPSSNVKTTMLPKNIQPLSDRHLLQHDSEDLSSLEQTISTSTFDNMSKDFNSMSDKLHSTSSRQIRPGDRVKSGSNRQLFKDQTKTPMYEANWYRRSIEMGQDHQEEAKQKQLYSSQRMSQSRFDKQTAVPNKFVSPQSPPFKSEGYKKDAVINRQGSKDKKINVSGQQTSLLPKKSSSKSLKQQMASPMPPNLQKHWNQLHNEMIDDKIKIPPKQFKSLKDNISPIHEESIPNISPKMIQQPLPKYTDKPPNYTSAMNIQRDPSARGTSLGSSNTQQQYTSRSVSDDRTSSTTKKDMSYVGSHHDPAIIIDSPVASNIVDMSSTSRAHSLIRQSQNEQPSMQSMGTTHTKSSSQVSRTQRTSVSSATSTMPSSSEQQSLTKSISSNVRQASDQSTARSSAAAASSSTQASSTLSKSNTISSSQSNQVSNETTKSSISAYSAATEAKPSNHLSNSNVQNPGYMLNPTMNERQTQSNTQGVSSVSIHTVATKSDSDSHMSRKSTGSYDSEHSLHNDSLLSPESAKKSRRKRRQEQRSKTVEDLRNQQTVPSQTNKSSSNPSITTPISTSSTGPTQKYLNKETSEIQYASYPSSSSTKTSGSDLMMNDKSRQTSHPSQMEKPSHQSSITQSLVSADTSSKQTTSQSPSTSANLSSTQTSSRVTSTTTASSAQSFSSTGTSATTATTVQSDISAKKGSETQSDASSTTKSSMLSRGNLHSSNKLNQVDHMSTVYEESEPSTGSNKTLTKAVPLQSVDRQQNDAHESTETASGSSSRTPSPVCHQPFRSPSKFESFAPLRSSNLQSHVETKIKHPTSKSPPSSSYHMKTITAKSITKTNTIDYEFRVQTGNGSRLDGTDEPVVVELTDEQGHVTRIPLHLSINNSKPFQKGQLDIFHLALPENFQAIKKLNLSLPKSNHDPLHIRYCELQDRTTMNTLYFPIETWLGEKNTFDIDMFINRSGNSEH